MDPDDFAAAPSMTVERFVPEADVLDHADVMVCHGGLGSVLGAIETATPMVIVPLGAEQLVNAMSEIDVVVESLVATTRR
jgi:UDP:flavonoid glycosyltransferase YjiC (YdhE family)